MHSEKSNGLTGEWRLEATRPRALSTVCGTGCDSGGPKAGQCQALHGPASPQHPSPRPTTHPTSLSVSQPKHPPISGPADPQAKSSPFNSQLKPTFLRAFPPATPKSQARSGPVAYLVAAFLCHHVIRCEHASLTGLEVTSRERKWPIQ